MREYELTVLFHPDLEIDLDAPLGKVRDIVSAQGGKIAKEDIWGKKKLAYKINKEEFAVYVHFLVELPPEAPTKVNSTLNITDEVVRYLLVAVDEKVRRAQAEEKKEDSAEEA